MCAAQGSHGIAELQDFKRLGDVIFYTEEFNPEVIPKMIFFQQKMALAVLGKLKFYVFIFVDYKLFEINKF